MMLFLFKSITLNGRFTDAELGQIGKELSGIGGLGICVGLCYVQNSAFFLFEMRAILHTKWLLCVAESYFRCCVAGKSDLW
jgi:hypothetical protein